MSRRVRNTYRALVSVLLLAALAIAVPIGLAAASVSRFGAANPLHGVTAPWRWLGDDAVERLATEPLADDTVVDVIVRLGLVAVWVALVVVLVTTLAETLHLIRHRDFSLPSMRGLGWAQGIGRFIAVGLILIGPLTTARGSLAAPPLIAPPVIALSLDDAATVAPGSVPDLGIRIHRPPADRAAHGDDPVHAVPRQESAPASDESRDLDTHVVTRGESVYSIAARLADGDPARTVEIADAILDANLGTVMPDGQRFTTPAYIEPGWVLVLPGAPDASPDPQPDVNDRVPAAYIVESGDTLSSIADEHLGDADDWTEIWDENAGDTMSDGRTFDDPNLIVPGWRLDLPGGVQGQGQVGSSENTTAHQEPPGRPSTPPTIGTSTPAEPPAAAPAEPSAAPAPTAPSSNPATTPSTAATSPAPAAPAPVSASPAPPAAPTSTTLPPPSTPSTPTAPVARSAPAASALPLPVSPGVAAPSATTSTLPPIGEQPVEPTASDRPDLGAPSPLRIEHAAMLAAGILGLVGLRRHRRLRTARSRSRIPEPNGEAAATERRLRAIDPGDRAERVDVAVRAAAHDLSGTDVQIGLVAAGVNGDVELRLTGSAELAAPWEGSGAAWALSGDVPIELLADAARRVGAPCVALVQIGVTPEGDDVLIDLEASGVLTVEAGSAHGGADPIVAAIAAGLAASIHAEVAHLITISLPEAATLGHRNAHRAASLDAALELAADLAGSTLSASDTTFALRCQQTGGEAWEPVVILMASTDDDDSGHLAAPSRSVEPGHGLAIVRANVGGDTGENRLVACAAGWVLEAFGCSTELTPIGLPADDLAAVVDLLDDAARPLVATDDHASGEPRQPGAGDPPLRGDPVERAEWSGAARPPADADPSGRAESSEVSDPSGGTDPSDDVEAHDGSYPSDVSDPTGAGIGPSGVTNAQTADGSTAPPFEPTRHDILVGLMGPVTIADHAGTPGVFERSKTIELIAWLATHREHSTRMAARTALWELDVRDATFANVVSEARRGLGRLVSPVDDEEWLARTLNEQLPLHDGVVTDADLIRERVRAATTEPPGLAIETLRPAVELIRDAPFAGTSYLWPDAEGLTSNLVLLAIGACAELAAHALATDDIELVFWATARGLKVLPGHEELIGLRMQAHARAGDLSGVRCEWEAYERVIVADAWSDGEPAPKLLALRRKLLDARR